MKAQTSFGMMWQEQHSCTALVDELAMALDLKDCSCQEAAAALRQRADALDSADCYDAHMAMGTLLAHRYAAAALQLHSLAY